MAEHDIQAAAVKLLRTCGRDAAKIFAVPNGGARHLLTAVKLKREGVTPGVPDLFLPVARGGYHGLFIEVKTPKGVVSPEQRTKLAELQGDGYRATICRSATEIVSVVTNYLLEKE